MMKALISGRAQRALVTAGSRLLSLEFTHRRVMVSRNAIEVHRAFGDVSDLHIAEVGSLIEARSLLERAVHCAMALDFALFLLDDRLSNHTRAIAARDLERVLADAHTREYLDGLLFAATLPASADGHGAMDICANAGYERSGFLVRDLLDHQREIADVATAWQTTAEKHTSSRDDRRELHARLLSDNWFPTFARALGAGCELEEVRQPSKGVTVKPIADGIRAAWIQEIYRIHASRVYAEGSPSLGRVSRMSELEQEVARQVQRETLVQRTIDCADGQAPWVALYSWEVVEALQDILFLSFPNDKHRDYREVVVEEVLLYFRSEGIYRYGEELKQRLGVVDYLGQVACCAMNKVLQQERQGNDTINVAELIRQEPNCGSILRFSRNRHAITWLYGLTRELRVVVWSRRAQAGLLVAGQVLNKPAAVLSFVWNHLRRKAHRMSFVKPR